MNILYIGDVMGEPGVRLVERILPEMRKQHSVDIVVAQSENVSEGKGMSLLDYRRLAAAGVDGFSGGNHSPDHPDAKQLLADSQVPITGPANMPDCPGPGFKYVGSGSRQVLLVSLLGQIVGKDAKKPTQNPLGMIDRILESQKDVQRAATIVNFHGDYSSEKVVIGHYLDGRVSMVVGDHWHVPTADARILPAGTAHMTDVGMCGVLNSSLGVTYDSIVPRWKSSEATRNVLAADPPYQFNALFVTIGDDGLATSTKAIQQTFDS